MANPIFEHPISNSPYDCLQRHWEHDAPKGPDKSAPGIARGDDPVNHRNPPPGRVERPMKTGLVQKLTATFKLIRSKGDQALFSKATQTMKAQWKVPDAAASNLAGITPRHPSPLLPESV